MELMLSLRVGNEYDRDSLLLRLVDMQYHRNDVVLERGAFRVRGDVLEIFPVGSGEKAIRVEFFGDEIDRICEIDTLTGEVMAFRTYVALFPASHYATTSEKMKRAIKTIGEELTERLAELKSQNKLL